MAITKLKRGSVAQAFTEAAPDAKPVGPKLRGRRQPLALALPPELVAEADRLAAAEERSRSKMVEMLLREAIAARKGAA
jgi:hypothetical protein